MSTELNLREVKREWHGTLKTYIIGFIGSLLLTMASFALVQTKTLEGLPLILSIVFLALLQAFLQLRFFLHLGYERKPKWETIVFYFMVLILLIIALGSLWIMFDLNNRTMSNMF